jgi:hypothetical protein
MSADQIVDNAIRALRVKDDPTALEEAQTEWTIHKQHEFVACCSGELVPATLVAV